MNDTNNFGQRVWPDWPTAGITYQTLSCEPALHERVSKALDEDGYQLFPHGRLTTGEEEFWNGMAWRDLSRGYAVGMSSYIFRRKKSWQP